MLVARKGELRLDKHPSRYLVIKHKETGEMFRLDPVDMPVPEVFFKVTSCIPIHEKYWDLPIYVKGDR